MNLPAKWEYLFADKMGLKGGPQPPFPATVLVTLRCKLSERVI